MGRIPTSLQVLPEALPPGPSQCGVTVTVFMKTYTTCSLLLLIPNHFSRMRDSFIKQHLPAEGEAEKRQKLSEAFAKLMADVKDNLLPKNREKFTQNASIFKNEAKSIAG